MSEPFDLEQIRLNWERARATPPVVPPAPAPAPVADPLALARAELARIGPLLLPFTEHRDLLGLFLQRLHDDFAQLELALSTGAPVPPARKALSRTIVDLEDMLETLLLTPRPLASHPATIAKVDPAPSSLR